MIMALLLDLANILGGFLLAIALLRRLPRVGDELGRAAEKVAAFGWLVGIVALVAGGYYVLVHLTSGPHLFHFEVVGIGVGLALLWDRLTGKQPSQAVATDATTTGSTAAASGAAPVGGTAPAAAPTTRVATSLLLAIFGIIAIIVGIQGLFTPDY